MSINWIASEDQIADIFTKPLARDLFSKFTLLLFGWAVPSQVSVNKDKDDKDDDDVEQGSPSNGEQSERECSIQCTIRQQEPQWEHWRQPVPIRARRALIAPQKTEATRRARSML